MPNAWIEHVKKYAKQHNIPYREALKKAKSTYKPQSGKGKTRESINEYMHFDEAAQNYAEKHNINPYLSPKGTGKILDLYQNMKKKTTKWDRQPYKDKIKQKLERMYEKTYELNDNPRLKSMILVHNQMRKNNN